MRCPHCGEGLLLSNPDPRTSMGKWGQSYITGAAEKTGVVMVDMPHGAPSKGGTCRKMTIGCGVCYRGPIDSRPSVQNAFAYRLAMMELEPHYRAYFDQLITELEVLQAEYGAKIVRFHGGGDFLDADYVRGWIRVAKALPKLKFFGTTRTGWLIFHPELKKPPFDPIMDPPMRRPINEFRTLPNVALGASLDAQTRTPELIRWLREQDPPWNIWNMLSEFTTKEARDAYDLKAATGVNHDRLAREQFETAKELGIFMGNGLAKDGCPEMTGEKPDCARCGWCFAKATPDRPRDVSFAYHP